MLRVHRLIKIARATRLQGKLPYGLSESMKENELQGSLIQGWMKTLSIGEVKQKTRCKYDEEEDSMDKFISLHN